MIDWAARKQATVSTSITEAELLALLHAGKACIWWINLFAKLRFDYDHKVKIFNDNLQIIRVLTSEQPKVTKKLLHMDVAQCWLRQSVQLGHLKVEYLQISRMTADGLTKSLSPQKHRSFLDMLGMTDVKERSTGYLLFYPDDASCRHGIKLRERIFGPPLFVT